MESRQHIMNLDDELRWHIHLLSIGDERAIQELRTINQSLIEDTHLILLIQSLDSDILGRFLKRNGLFDHGTEKLTPLFQWWDSISEFSRQSFIRSVVGNLSPGIISLDGLFKLGELSVGSVDWAVFRASPRPLPEFKLPSTDSLPAEELEVLFTRCLHIRSFLTDSVLFKMIPRLTVNQKLRLLDALAKSQWNANRNTARNHTWDPLDTWNDRPSPLAPPPSELKRSPSCSIA